MNGKQSITKTDDIDRPSKRAIVAEFLQIQALAQKYVKVSLALAVELYRYDPDCVLFKQGLFTDASLNQIRVACEQSYRTSKRGRAYRFARWLLRKVTPALVQEVTQPVSE